MENSQFNYSPFQTLASLSYNVKFLEGCVLVFEKLILLYIYIVIYPLLVYFAEKQWLMIVLHSITLILIFFWMKKFYALSENSAHQSLLIFFSTSSHFVNLFFK